MATGSFRFTFDSPELTEKLILSTYLSMKQINVAEEDPLEQEFGLLDGLVDLYTHLRLEAASQPPMSL